jgi:uncharacterized protein YjbJ (UPF0337 family)
LFEGRFNSYCKEIVMNWDQAKTEIKTRWDKLTDHQLQDRVPGTRDQLIANIQGSYDVSRHDAERLVVAWEACNQNTDEHGEGIRDQLIGNVQETFNISMEEAEHQVEMWGTKNAGEIAEFQKPTGGPWAHWPHT